MSVLKNRAKGSLVSLIETNERYIMQGQVYDKDDMKFEFMNFLPITTTEKNSDVMSVMRRCTSNSDNADNYDYHCRRSRGDMIIQDKDDINISYSIIDSEDCLTTNTSRIVKFQTKDGITTKVWESTPSITMTGKNRATAVEVLGQDDTFIIVLYARSYNYSWGSYSSAYMYNQHAIYKINKATGDFTVVFDENNNGEKKGSGIRKIYETDSTIYFSYFNGYENLNTKTVLAGELAVYAYKKTNSTLVLVDKISAISDTENKYANCVYASQGFKDKNDENKVIFYQYTNLRNPEINIIEIDTVTDTVTHRKAITTFNSKVTKLPGYYSTSADVNKAITAELFIKEIDGKKYLNIIGYCTQRIVDMGELNKITTLLINEDDNYDLIAQDCCDPFNNSPIRGFVDMIDEDLLLITNRSAAKVFKFDTVKGKYTEIQIVNIPNNCIGCDSKNNIWITDTASNIHKYTVELPVDVQLSFDTNSIDYKGTDIDTNIILEAYNYKNERTAVKLELTIKGPMTFADGSKKITTISSKTEKVKIPAIVKNSGIISVYPKVLL